MKWTQTNPGELPPGLELRATGAVGGGTYEYHAENGRVRGDEPASMACGHLFVRTPEGTWWEGSPQSDFDRLLCAWAARTNVRPSLPAAGGAHAA